ncbi:MAG: hypothetical protein HRT91_03660 [Piscirickettsiaceae bacterium]|nr:hypothetical protein [Piscirickettsiaceae bacterium]
MSNKYQVIPSLFLSYFKILALSETSSCTRKIISPHQYTNNTMLKAIIFHPKLSETLITTLPQTKFSRNGRN